MDTRKIIQELPSRFQKRYLTDRWSKIKLSLFILFCIFFLYFLSLPEYIEINDFNTTSYHYRDVTLQIVVYKAKYNPVLYDEIAEAHNKINGIPDKLTLQLYHTKYAAQKGGKPYRTVVFDYDKNINYILIGNL